MELWRESAALVVVFALLGAALWSLRRRSGSLRASPSKSLIAIDRIALTPQHAVHLIRAPGRDLLVATHPQGCTLLADGAPSENSVDPPRTVAPLHREHNA